MGNKIKFESFYLMEDAHNFAILLMENGVQCDIVGEANNSLSVYTGNIDAKMIHVYIDSDDEIMANLILEADMAEVADADNNETPQNATNHDKMQENQEMDLDMLEEELFPKNGIAVKPGYLILGYFSAFLGGFIAIILGYLWWNFQNKMPNGETYFYYDQASRNHGKVIFFLGLTVILGTLIIYYVI